MRASRLFTFGLATVLGGTSTGFAQFAVDRSPTPTPPVPFAQPRTAGSSIAGTGFQPAAPPASAVRPASGTQAYAPPPAPAIEVPLALANHPLALKPEHGPYVICVKSYVRPAWVTEGVSAMQLAEELANEIRTAYRMPAFLIEYVSEEKKAEMVRRQAALREREPFLKALEDQRKRAELNGSIFLEPERGNRADMIRYKTVRYNDQFAVVIGGFRTDTEARKALDAIRKWPAPKNKGLMDSGDILKPGPNGKPVVEQSYLNPYPQAFVAPNPTAPKATAAPTSGLDDFTIRLNEGRPYNLLKARPGSWTLAVKTFSAPTTMQGRDSDPTAMRRPTSSGADVLNAGASQAEQLAKILRDMKDASGNAKGFEAFVLHSRAGSLVTVGQYDSADAAELLADRRTLMNMNFMISERANVPGRPLDQSNKLFSDNILPIPVPR